MNRLFLPASAIAGVCLVVGALAQQEPKVMSFEDCISHARENSPELKKKLIAYDTRELNTIMKWSRFSFNMTARGSQDPDAGTTSSSLEITKEFPAGIDLSSSVSVNDNGETDGRSQSYSITLSKIILGGGSLLASRLDIMNSLIDETMEMNSLNKYRRELEYRVRSDYYRTIRNVLTLKVQKMRLERAVQNLEHAIERERPLDIATAKIQIPENEAAVSRAERAIKSSLDDLKELMGMDLGEDIAVDENFSFVEETIDFGKHYNHALENHEDILNARLALKKAENSEQVLRSRIWPQARLYGTASRDEDDAAVLEEEQAAEYTFGISASWEIGARGSRAEARIAKNGVESSKLDIETVERAKAKKLRDLGDRLEEALRLVHLQEQSVELGEFQHALYKDRWENGDIDILEYVRSQNDLENSKIQLINSKTSYMELLGEYDYETGR